MTPENGAPAGPSLTAVEPAVGAPGDTLRAYGSGFGGERGEGNLLFGTLAAGIVSWSDTLVAGLVPAAAQSGPVKVVTDGGAESNALVFVVTGGTVPPPALTELVPARTVVGDTLRIAGTGFIGEQGDGRVVFAAAAGGEIVVSNVLVWSSDGVRVLVPAGAGSGDVKVRVSGGDSNGLVFEVAPQLISYVDDVDPLFAAHGCKGCHGGSGGLFLDTHASLMRGDSDHGPVVTPRRGEASILVEKLRPSPPFGSRMPFAGDPLPDSDILTIADWIDQGARNN